MSEHPSRRDFLKASVSAACAAGVAATARDALAAAPAPETLSIKKGVLVDMLPKNLSYLDRFKLARAAGFEALQVNTTPDEKEAQEIKQAAEQAGIRIDSIMNMDHWRYPLSSSDPAVVEKSLNGMRTSLHNARLWGAKYVLLVPAVVNAQTGYHAAWTRSQEQIRKLIPLAEQLGVVIAIEEVWNKFLLSPLEMATYVDQFKSPYVKVWFDVGNVVLYGYPEDWIHTLGHRIAELHIKDFKRPEHDCFKWVNLGEGDVDWPAVRKALAEIGYHGTATVELPGGDEAYLRDVSQRVDRLVLGAQVGMPVT